MVIEPEDERFITSELSFSSLSSTYTHTPTHSRLVRMGGYTALHKNCDHNTYPTFQSKDLYHSCAALPDRGYLLQHQLTLHTPCVEACAPQGKLGEDGGQWAPLMLRRAYCPLRASMKCTRQWFHE